MTNEPDLFPPEIRKLDAFDGPFDAHRVRAENCDVLFATYPAGTIIDPRRHDTDNVGVVTKGRLHLSLDGTETSCGPGDWYHVPAHQGHAARFEADSAEIEFWFRTSRSETRAPSRVALA
jgi:quercetin dioxygenase-like cupin family protein